MQSLGRQRADHAHDTQQQYGQQHCLQRGPIFRSSSEQKEGGITKEETGRAYGEYEYLPSSRFEFILAQASSI